MNKIDAENLFSQILDLFLSKKGNDFENFFHEDVVCYLNSSALNLEELRLVILSFANQFLVEKILIDNFLYEDEKAIINGHFQIQNTKASEHIAQNFFCVFHFKNKEVKACWLLTSLPIHTGKKDGK